jgi:hypothetical protein
MNNKEKEVWILWKGVRINRGVIRYFCLILTFCGTTKKEWLLGKNYFNIPNFCKLQGDVTQKTHPLKRMILLQTNF